jgi:hypothetical protein
MTRIEQTAAEYVTEQMEQGFHLIPPHMRDSIKLYILHGIPPGSFLTALLSNDFMGAVARADSDNGAALIGWGRFFYNYVPSGSHGSPAAFRAWTDKGGAMGNQHADEQVSA